MTSSFFFFNDTATTEIYTLSLHDALPIWHRRLFVQATAIGLLLSALVAFLLPERYTSTTQLMPPDAQSTDRKSTRLNSSHLVISYAVFCLKKKKDNHHRCCRLGRARHRAE